MKNHIGRPTSKNIGAVIAVIAAIVFLFPFSSSVLCVAPGSHIAIEDVNASCCASGISAASDHQLEKGFSSAGDCRNCTDFYITSAGRGVATVASCNTGVDPQFSECLSNELSADLSLLQWTAGAFNDIGISPLPTISAIPMRC